MVLDKIIQLRYLAGHHFAKLHSLLLHFKNTD